MHDYNGFDPVLAAEKAADAPAKDERAERRPRNTKANGLSPVQVERQSRVVRMAFLALDRPQAIAFLNDYDPALGGRPLDLALESAEGLAAVEQALRSPKP